MLYADGRWHRWCETTHLTNEIGNAIQAYLLRNKVMCQINICVLLIVVQNMLIPLKVFMRELYEK